MQMKTKSKIKKCVLCAAFAVLLAAAVQISAFAEYIHGYFRYTVDDSSVTITSYTGREEDVTVPAMIGGNPVNVIASGAFADNGYVKTVRLPDTVTTVEAGAFGADQRVIFASEIQTGDVNADGAVNNKDVVALFKYVSEKDTGTAPAVFDVNEDGSVNNKDVVALFKQVSAA